MMRRDGNVINLEAVLIVLPYAALYFLMWLNVLIIQGEKAAGRRKRKEGARDERCLKCPDECLLPQPRVLLSFSLCRRDKHLGKTRWLFTGVWRESREEGSPLKGKGGGEGVIHIFCWFVRLTVYPVKVFPHRNSVCASCIQICVEDRI